MAVEVRDDGLVVMGNVSIEEVEAFAEALDSVETNADGRLRVDLGECLYLHTGAVQLLMKKQCEVMAWPQSSEWTLWLKAGLQT